MRIFRQATQRKPGSHRTAATMVETAVILPVFFIMISGVLEFGHVYMVIHSLNSAANKASRLAATEGATNAQVTSQLVQNLSTTFNTGKMRVLIKDASAYDDTEVDPNTITVDQMPNLEISTAISRQLLLVRVEVSYDEITIVPSFWKRIIGAEIVGQSIMRHE